MTLVIATDASLAIDSDALARRAGASIRHATTLDALVDALDYFAERQGYEVLLDLEPWRSDDRDPSDLVATFRIAPGELQAAIA
jgi:hypothetical protein